MALFTVFPSVFPVHESLKLTLTTPPELESLREERKIWSTMGLAVFGREAGEVRRPTPREI